MSVQVQGQIAFRASDRVAYISTTTCARINISVKYMKGLQNANVEYKYAREGLFSDRCQFRNREGNRAGIGANGRNNSHGVSRPKQRRGSTERDQGEKRKC